MGRLASKGSFKVALKTFIGLLVLAAVSWHVFKTCRALSVHKETLRVNPSWAAASLCLYVVGLATVGVGFATIMRVSPTPVPMPVAVRAYVISHLGKYVPGKAMVVIVRVGLLVPFGARPAVAALATFYETFAMMASGALLATLGFALGTSSVQKIPLLLSLGLAILLFAVIEPRFFHKLIKLVSIPFPKASYDVLTNLNHRLAATVLAWCTGGWIFWGLSQVALIEGIYPGTLSIEQYPAVLAGVALATVSGFVVAVMPAGLGVREGVLMATLGPILGEERAVVASLGLRLVWVVGEIFAGGLFSVWRPSRQLQTAASIQAGSHAS